MAALKREETASELMDRRRTMKLQALVMISALFKTFVIATLSSSKSYVFSSSLAKQ